MSQNNRNDDSGEGMVKHGRVVVDETPLDTGGKAKKIVGEEPADSEGRTNCDMLKLAKEIE